ncbi:MAG: hypothetical protein K0Q50_2708 [Vampirovibrio sp.]|jgi:N-acetylglucosaminyldiphosphoundecaprenol N-acetyl-beta-D-mannosaminyltransferase|nr:hypothetical protein [Vampirovibrio sp.]
MNLEEFRRNRFVRNFAKDKWLIFASAGTVTLFAIVYVTLLYKPAFSSDAKVWIKDTSTRSYVSDNPDAPGYLSSLTSSGNPIMTQSEILTSREMENYLADYVMKEEARLNKGKPIHDRGDTSKIITVKTEPNTDILQVKLKWDEPAMAKTLLSTALTKLDETNLSINRQIHSKKRSYIEDQLGGIQSKLLAVREQIKQYQSGNNAIDVDTQTQELVKLKSQLTAQLETALAAHKAHATNSANLQRQLNMTPKMALQAVALGSGNETMTKMRTDLAALKQQYAHDSIKLAPTNPQLVALKQQIDSLESQLESEVAQTSGSNPNTKNVRIYDNVRSNLAQMMNEFQARSAAMGTEAASLRDAIAKVDASLKAIPQSKFTLTGLQEEEKALALAYDEMRKKQIEIQIKEAETPSNVFIVDSPSLPKRPSFPTGLHIVLLSALLGLGAGLGLSVAKTSQEDLCEGAEAVEEATHSKVLGIIPWLDASEHYDDQSVFARNDLAAKHIISNLRIEASKHEAQVIGFTSSALDKPKSGGAYHLAQCMAALGQSVAFIDADLRPSRLPEAVVDGGSGLDLTDLILSIDLKLRSGQVVYPEEVMSGLMRDENGIFLAMNRNAVANGFDYFASKGFRQIVNVLKEQFDWVFIDTPPALIAPEFMAISHISDGVVLFADKNATYQTLRKISARVYEAQVPFIGTIAREENVRLEQEHEIYSNWRGPGKGGGGSLVASASKSYQKKRVDFMGAKIDALSMRETLDRISEIIDHREHAQHVVVNVAKLMTMQKDRQLRQIVNSCDLINADGAGVVLGAKLLGINIPERVAGIDLMHQLVALASQRNYRIFFLGAEEDVVRDVVTNYKRLYPDLQICGYRNGYFSKDEEQDVAEKVREANPDILFVAMSSPKKEKFINQYKELMDVPFMMGVGGSFDVMAGKVQRAPKWMQDAGLEWFFRLIQEPGRMWKRYLVTNVQFGFALAGQVFSGKMRAANG